MSKKPAAKGKDLTAFRAAHDPAFIIPNKIRAALAELGDSWESEVEFIRRSGTSTTNLAMYREQFAEFYVEIGGRNTKRLWAGTKGFAAKMRETVGQA